MTTQTWLATLPAYAIGLITHIKPDGGWNAGQMYCADSAECTEGMRMVRDEATWKVLQHDQGQADEVAAHILLVDDEPSNVKLLERTLQSYGYFSLAFTTAPRSVLDLCQEHDFDLIILDLNMPYLDGFQVKSELRSLNNASPPPILVVTAQHHQDYRVRALREVPPITSPSRSRWMSC